MYYITDTHSFIWYLTDDQRLSQKAYAIFEACDRGEEIIGIPTIVLAEMIHICEKKRANIKFKSILEKMSSSLNYQPLSLTMSIILKIIDLTQIPDMYDRIIIATASMINGTLITKDKDIRESNLVKTLW